MRTAEEIYQDATCRNLSNPAGTRMDIILDAINIGRREAIEECARNAESYVLGMPDPSPDDVKQSILNLINELK